MCLVSKPKVAATPTATQKDPAVLRNPFLDGLDPIIRARSTGLSALRIDRGTAGVQNPSNSTASPLVTTGSKPPETKVAPEAAIRNTLDRVMGKPPRYGDALRIM